MSFCKVRRFLEVSGPHERGSDRGLVMEGRKVDLKTWWVLADTDV